ncbi:F0F1 ATP synthase subunit epsilon [Pseudooceanicola nanhaiensis]|uniref:F0F1 ATP synthase subunit epsilon n=1 Tax=Pseudooceanicola nanhaiensis TaxID=375761 RepID=UPI001CD786D5|nr:F0F1 ATP synthase subunit epsilon [Pseudooceanicola nanhaiensis]MCA0920137.1 F0F1 ATP synthase subunit epsilon [Pseudooceanicola nanhaiensis]
MSGLHLTVTTPMEVLVDEEGVLSVRAEDASGGFGILPGHTDYLTALPASVLRWKSADGQRHVCALRSGMLTVEGGRSVAIACREGVLGTDLAALEETVRDLARADDDTDRRERVEQMRLHAQAVRQLMQFMRPGRPAGPSQNALTPEDAGGDA